MMAGLLFARAGLDTVVVEKHRDFLRDFRGDTVHPSTLQLIHELGLLDALLARPHNKVETIGARIGGQPVEIVDFRHLPVAAPFIALMPQWDFLDFVADAARRYPTFRLVQGCEAETLVEADGRVAGARMQGGETIAARLTIASDGRDSRFCSGLPATTIGAPMDVFWFRIPKAPARENDSMGVFDAGRIFVLIDRGDYWQCAFVFAKGTAETVHSEGFDAFVARVLAVGPETARATEGLRSWDDVKLLTVTVDRLERWHRPGLLVIGDAAHAMSPIGGVGINLAIQDAVAAANLLAAPMRAGEDIDPLLHRVRDRRHRAVQLTQRMQRLVQDRVIAPMLSREDAVSGAPAFARLLDRIPMLRRIPARIIGLGFRPEHIQSPEAR
ncbi:Monooxygenase [Sphingomonas sp. EC-HK361]|nr:Monooxygenase [Sphingomonas sp. EC-HK361]